MKDSSISICVSSKILHQQDRKLEKCHFKTVASVTVRTKIGAIAPECGKSSSFVRERLMLRSLNSIFS